MAEGEQDFFVFETGDQRNACEAAKKPGKHVYVMQWRALYVWGMRDGGTYGWVQVGDPYPANPYTSTPPVEPPVEPPVQPPSSTIEMRRFLNPYGAKSAHHAPRAKNITWGISAGAAYNGSTATPARPGQRGRLSILGNIQLTKGNFTKHAYETNTNMDYVPVYWNGETGGGTCQMPLTKDSKTPKFYMPAAKIREIFYPLSITAPGQKWKENTLILYDPEEDMCYDFYNFGVDRCGLTGQPGEPFCAQFMHRWTFSGTDNRYFSDPYENGTNATKHRFLMGVARHFEYLNAKKGMPIYHGFQAAASYNNNAQGGVNPANTHILSPNICPTATATDGSAKKNMGDIPAGQLCFIHPDFYDRRSSLNPFEQIIFDAFRDYGIRIVDGTSAITSRAKPGVFQIRSDNGPASGGQWPEADFKEFQAACDKCAEWFWPVVDSNIYQYSDGNWYAGGNGGPGSDTCKSWAWDSK